MAPSDAELLGLAGPLRVLTLADLREAGLSRKQIRTRVLQGRLQRLWEAMYLVGPATPEPLSWARAAALSCADRFVTSGWGAFAHGFGREPRLPVDVVTARGSHDGIDGMVRVHRSRVLLRRDVADLDGIAITSPARAILDCGDWATIAQLERLIAEAELKKTVTRVQLEDVLSRAGRRAAAKRLARALEDGPGITRSEAERMLRRLLREAGIEQPLTDYPIGIYFADFAWPRYKFIVEFDSYSHHGGKRAFYRDRDRNGWLIAQGWDILPVTWEQLTERPLEAAARIAAAIAVRRST